MENAVPSVIQPYLPMIKGIALALLIFIVGWSIARVAARLVLRALTHRDVDLALSRFFAQITRYTVLAATVIAALGAVGVETTSLLAIFASAGLAVGLALQGTLAHFASGVMILLFRPINIGDVVTAGGHTGKVEDIGLFATILITPSNEKIIIPNGKIMGDSIVNLTVLGMRRGSVDVGVAYGTDVNKARAVLERAARQVAEVLDDPAPIVAMTGLGASSVDFAVMGYCNAADYLAMLNAMKQSIYDELNGAGIEIPFNQIVVHQAR